jgi:hypothetical protein
VQGVGAAAFLALVIRLALLLGATPVGSMRQEILYLRGDLFRPLVRVGVLFLGLEAGQLLLPMLQAYGVVRALWVPTLLALVDVVQAALLVVIAAGTLRVFSPYSRRSLAELEVVARRSVEAVARRVPRPPAPSRGGRSR